MGKWNFFDFLGKKLEPTEALLQSLTTEVAMKEIALYIGTSYIANALSQCEFKTFEKGEEVKDELYYKLNVSPNPNQNSSQFINKFVNKCLYDGHSLVVQHKNNLICADSFDIEDDNPLIENVFVNVDFKSHRAKAKYKAKEVFYFKLDNDHAKKYIDALYRQYGEIVMTAMSAYKKTNSEKYKLILEQYSAGDPKFKQVYDTILKNQLDSFIKGNGSAVYPQYKGTQLEEFKYSTVKDTSDIVAVRKEVFETTAQALKIPLSMMYGNITNMDEIVQVFLTFCVDAWADMVQKEITRKYYSFDEWKKGSYVKVDTSCINHADILKVADKVDKAISSGATNIDEIRKRLGMQELGTEFSTSYFMTKNYELDENMLKNNSEGGE